MSDAANERALGAVLALLHDAELGSASVAVSYRVWRHQPRLHEAFMADAEHQRRRGASISTFTGASRGEPEPDEREEVLRVWRDGQRARVEHHGGDQDGSYAVADPPLWWMWGERMGAHSNEDDPSVGSNVGQDMDIMLNPAPLLSLLRFTVTGRAQLAGRAAVLVDATPRPIVPPGMSIELSRLGSGADLYELAIDAERGFLLSATARRNGLPFHSIETLEMRIGEPIAPELFRFEAPEGEEITSRRTREPHRNVTLVQAQQQVPFTVLALERVPDGWQQMSCSLLPVTTRPPSPLQLVLSYRSVDNHESLSINEMASDAADHHRGSGDPEDWEEVTQAGVSLKTRPANWGQAQVELDRDGTFVFLTSDNLSRDQLVRLAFGLRPAPSTSSI